MVKPRKASSETSRIRRVYYAGKMAFRGQLRKEFQPLLELAVPLVLGELGWMAMSLVDTIMVGRVSKEAIGAVSLGGMLFHAVAVIGIGVLLALDTLVSQSFGAGDTADCHHSLIQALYLCLPLAPLLRPFVGMPTTGGYHHHSRIQLESQRKIRTVKAVSVASSSSETVRRWEGNGNSS